jgi:hypothetical protein
MRRFISRFGQTKSFLSTSALTPGLLMPLPFALHRATVSLSAYHGAVRSNINWTGGN